MHVVEAIRNTKEYTGEVSNTWTNLVACADNDPIVHWWHLVVPCRRRRRRKEHGTGIACKQYTLVRISSS